MYTLLGIKYLFVVANLLVCPMIVDNFGARQFDYNYYNCILCWTLQEPRSLGWFPTE